MAQIRWSLTAGNDLQEPSMVKTAPTLRIILSVTVMLE